MRRNANRWYSTLPRRPKVSLQQYRPPLLLFHCRLKDHAAKASDGRLSASVNGASAFMVTVVYSCRKSSCSPQSKYGRRKVNSGEGASPVLVSIVAVARTGSVVSSQLCLVRWIIEGDVTVCIVRCRWPFSALVKHNNISRRSHAYLSHSLKWPTLRQSLQILRASSARNSSLPCLTLPLPLAGTGSARSEQI